MFADAHISSLGYLWRNHCSRVGNIRICMWKKPIVSVTYENESLSIKNSLPYIMICVTFLLRGPLADLWPFYGLYWTASGPCDVRI